jgi:hypothetical protein
VDVVVATAAVVVVVVVVAALGFLAPGAAAAAPGSFRRMGFSVLVKRKGTMRKKTLSPPPTQEPPSSGRSNSPRLCLCAPSALPRFLFAANSTAAARLVVLVVVVVVVGAGAEEKAVSAENGRDSGLLVRGSWVQSYRALLLHSFRSLQRQPLPLPTWCRAWKKKKMMMMNEGDTAAGSMHRHGLTSLFCFRRMMRRSLSCSFFELCFYQGIKRLHRHQLKGVAGSKESAVEARQSAAAAAIQQQQQRYKLHKLTR